MAIFTCPEWVSQHAMFLAVPVNRKKMPLYACGSIFVDRAPASRAITGVPNATMCLMFGVFKKTVGLFKHYGPGPVERAPGEGITPTTRGAGAGELFERAHMAVGALC